MYTGYTQRPLNGSEQRIFKFPNGCGASVIRGRGTYGGDQGLWELAVLDAQGSIVYDTPITDDVLGYLSEAEVNNALDLIAALPNLSAPAPAPDKTMPTTIREAKKVASPDSKSIVEIVDYRRLNDLEIATAAVCWIAAQGHADEFNEFLRKVVF